MPRRDGYEDARNRERGERLLLELQIEALQHQLAVARDPRYDAERYADRSTKTGTTAKWAETFAADARARRELDAGPKLTSVVVVVPRMAPTKEGIAAWEQLHAAHADGKVIEAQAVPDNVVALPVNASSAATPSSDLPVQTGPDGATDGDGTT